MRNLTSHRQGTVEMALARQAGFELSPEPEGVEAPPGGSGLAEASARLARKLLECGENGAAALAGGLTPLWIAAALRASAVGPLPEIYWLEMRTRHGGHDPVGVWRCW
jgi:hypothetical protein